MYVKWVSSKKGIAISDDYINYDIPEVLCMDFSIDLRIRSPLFQNDDKTAVCTYHKEGEIELNEPECHELL